ncbi:MAG: hypothetical protein HS116_26030 [Planctomycetes bacterium]|nr:hypothetical protein [Planctomycetota bacterium]
MLLQAFLLLLLVGVLVYWFRSAQEVSSPASVWNAAAPTPLWNTGKAPAPAPTFAWNSVAIMKQTYLQAEGPQRKGAQFEALVKYIEQTMLNQSYLTRNHMLDYLGTPDLESAREGEQAWAYFYSKIRKQDAAVVVRFADDGQLTSIDYVVPPALQGAEWKPFVDPNEPVESPAPDPAAKTDAEF